MAELPKGVRLVYMLRGSLVQMGVSWQGVALVDGLSKDWIGDFGLKMLFIEIHIYLTSLHLAGTTTYAWSRWSRLVISNFLLLPLVFVVFSRLDSFFTISTQRNLYASRLFLVSLVPWIDKPWGNTLREKLHEPCACGIQIGGAKEHQHKPSSFATYYLIELCQIVVTLSEIHFIFPWSRSCTCFDHMLCFYTGSKQTPIHPQNKYSMLHYDSSLKI